MKALLEKNRFFPQGVKFLSRNKFKGLYCKGQRFSMQISGGVDIPALLKSP
jgi:hypothetical protein